MIFTHNDIDYVLPDTLADVTLQQMIDWSMQYGFTLQEQSRLNPGKSFQDIVYYALSFFTGIPLDECRTIDYQTVFDAYAQSALYPATLPKDALMPDDFLQIDLNVLWNDQPWQIYTPVESVTIGHVTDQEFKAALQSAQILTDTQLGNWMESPFIFCFLFREVGEPFDPAFLQDRYEQMKTLPLSIVHPSMLYWSEQRESFNTVIQSFLSPVINPSHE